MTANSLTAVKVLIVEDSATMRAVCCDRLTKEGFDCDLAASAESAWEQLQQSADKQVYGAILLDWILPQASGEEFLCKLKDDARFDNVAVMIFTESPDQAVWKQVLSRNNIDIQLKAELDRLPQRMSKFIDIADTQLVTPVAASKEPLQTDADPETILLVDDSATVRVRYCSLLREAGYHVIEASGCQEGLEVAQQNKPSLAIVDFYMPDGNGDQLCRELMADASLDTTIVMFSQRKEVTELALGAGALDLLFKDDPTNIFLMRINALMEIIRSKRVSRQLDLLVWATQALGFGIMRCTPEGLKAENPIMEMYQLEMGGLEVFNTRASFESPLEVPDLSGDPCYFSVQRYPSSDQEEVVVVHDISLMKSAEQEVQDAKNQAVAAKGQLEVLLNAAGEGILGINLSGDINFVNPKAATLLGLSKQGLLARNIQSFFVLEDDHRESLNQLVKKLHNSPIGLMDQWNKTQIEQLLTLEVEQHAYWTTEAGETIYVEYNCNPTFNAEQKQVGAVVMFQNISQRKELEDKLVNLANFDPLTGLANRAHFHITLTQAIERQKRAAKTLALLYLDLDHFKYINDSLGHDAGDELLSTTAKLLRASVRAGDLIARLGGDEFAIVLHDINDFSDASAVAQKILTTLSEPVTLGSTQVNISFSIGIAVLNEELNCLQDLVKAADTAMYVAKNEGRNNFKFFIASMQEETEQKQRIQTQLQRAISDQELALVFQPKVSLSAKKITGCEALLRWQPKDKPAISPAVFVPHAEESGQIVELGEWVLNAACEQISEWLKLPGYDGLVMSINVSVRQLGKNKFYPLIQQVLAKYKVPANAIEIEITETGVMENMDRLIDELKSIQDLGVKIAIDDFGTGSSSLELLRKLPLDVLKIDRGFVADIGQDKQDEEIIRVMLAVARTLQLEVVAEGAETLEQILFLSMANCELIQGYYFSKPLCAEDFIELLTSTTGAFYDQFSNYYKTLQKGPVLNVSKQQQAAPLKNKRFKVLVCEDDLSIGYIIQKMLAKNNFIADLAMSAAEGLNMLKNRHYDAMTLDLEFGNCNGLDFLQQVRGLYSEIVLPVVVVSGHVDNEIYRKDIRRLGIANWLSKPLQQNKLLASFEGFVSQRRLSGLPKILHVEDVEDQRQLVKLVLEDVAQLTSAADLAQAREALKFTQYDLILLDLKLPDGSGIELLDTIEQLDDSPPVYVLTGAQKDDLLAQRVEGVLDKTDETFEQLNSVVMAALHKRLGQLTGQRVH